jgi:hypothetical protein
MKPVTSNVYKGSNMPIAFTYAERNPPKPRSCTETMSGYTFAGWQSNMQLRSNRRETNLLHVLRGGRSFGVERNYAQR